MALLVSHFPILCQLFLQLATIIYPLTLVFHTQVTGNKQGH